MRVFAVITFFFITATAFAQSYQQYDTIANPEIALQQLHSSIKKYGPTPELYCLVAEKHFEIEKFDSVTFFANRSIELLAKNPNNKLLSKALFVKGRAQYFLDDKAKAEINWRQGLQLAEKENAAELIPMFTSYLGAIYLDLAYVKNNAAFYFTADSFFTIGYRQLIKLKALQSEHGLRSLRLMATSLHFQKKYDSAAYYYEKVIPLSKDKSTLAYLGGLSFYALMLSETGKHNEAVSYIKEAVEYGKAHKGKTKDMTHIMHVYGRVLYNKGNFPEAYKFMDSAYQLLATDYVKVNSAAYAESESKFKNEILQYQVKVEQQKKNRLYYILAGLGLLTALVVLLLQNKNNKKIATEKARQKQISIDAFIEGEEKEKVRIGRELHDGIAQEIVAVKLAMQQQPGNEKMVDELARISLDIRNISHELMPQTLKEYGLKLAIEDICQKILAPSGIQYEIHSSLPDERMPGKIEITLYRVFQELVHNIIKHSHATEVLVQLRKMNNHILLVVEDNGQGMTDEKKNGIGISNLKSRVQLLDGNLQYDSSENEGTTAIVRVPL